MPKQSSSCKDYAPWTKDLRCKDDLLESQRRIIFSERQFLSPSSLPAPIPIRKQCTDSKPPTDCKALISVAKPHWISAVSAGLFKFVGLTREETRTRTIKLLYGPDTDCFAISKAIEEMVSNLNGTNMSIIPSLTIYDRHGHARTFKVVCSPHEPMTDGCFTHCSLRFEPAAVDMRSRRIAPIGVKGNAVNELLTSSYRSRYNFMTGLEIHHALAEIMWKRSLATKKNE
jgi:hypothetical protein